MDLLSQKLPSKRQAEILARSLGGSGAHPVEGGWMPCESPRLLNILIEEGVAAYRKARSEKGFFTGLGVMVKKRRAWKIRPASFDADAIDADGDGLVQEGTTAERTGIGKKPGSKTRTVIKNADKVSGSPKPKKRNTLKAKAKKFKPVKRSEFLDDGDKDMSAFNGIGRVRAAGEGVHPSVVSRLAEINQDVESRHGPLSTIPQMEKAMKAAFPNAKIDLKVKRVEPPSIYEQDEKLDEKMTRSEIKAMKGHIVGLLHMSDVDPESAKKVGSVFNSTLGDPDGFAFVTGRLDSSVDAPVHIGLSANTSVSKSPNLAQATMMQHRFLVNAVNEERQNGFNGILNADQEIYATAKDALMDGDIEAASLYTSVHEWGHVVGMAQTYDQMAPIIEAGKKWIESGDDNGLLDAVEAMNALGYKLEVPELFVGDVEDVALGNPSLEKFFEGFGIVIDSSDKAQVEKAYRVLALRAMSLSYYNEIRDTNNRSAEGTDYDKLVRLSMYGIVDTEEAIAEGYAVRYFMPEAYDFSAGDIESPNILKRFNLWQD